MAAPPGVDINNAYVKLGLLPVNIAPYNAVGDGVANDTSALQLCLDDSIEYGYIAFLPAGLVFSVTDTLEMMKPVTFSGGSWKQERRESRILLGSTAGTMPRIVKSASASGFNNSGNPKAVLHVWAQRRTGTAAGSTDPDDEQASILFNETIENVEVDVSLGSNSGAVGIRFAGSQGASLVNVKVVATGAYAGIYNFPGQGAGSYNIEVVGGSIGIKMDENCRYPTLVGVKLTDQTSKAIEIKTQAPLVMAGFEISTSSTTTAIDLDAAGATEGRCAISLVDGSITTASGGEAITNTEGHNVYLENVYVTGATNLIQSGAQSAISLGGGTTRIDEYSFAGAITGEPTVSLIDGNIHDGEYQLITTTASATTPADIRTRHVNTSIPSWEDAGMVNAKDHGVTGNGSTDDTSALNAVLAANDDVFLPFGTYIISGTIDLSASNNLVGLNKVLCIIKTASSWTPTDGTPMVRTADDASATTTLSNVLLEIHPNVPEPTHLLWRGGRNSALRNVMAGVDSPNQTAPAVDKRIFEVTGNGGGRFYTLVTEATPLQWYSDHASYRVLLVDGTSEPLYIYAQNIERSNTSPQAEIKNASNVKIYNLKMETDVKVGHATVDGLQINNSSAIRVYTYSGNAKPAGFDLIQVTDSSNVIVSTMSQNNTSTSFNTIRQQVTGDPDITVLGSKRVALYKLAATNPPDPEEGGGVAFESDFTAADGTKLDSLTGWSLQGSEGGSVMAVLTNQLESNGGGAGSGATVYVVDDVGAVSSYIQFEITNLSGASANFFALRMVDADNLIGIRVSGVGGSGLKFLERTGGVNGDEFSTQGVVNTFYRIEQDYGTNTVRLYSRPTADGTKTLLYTGTFTNVSNTETTMGVVAGGNYSMLIDNWRSGPLDETAPGDITDLATGTVGDTSIALSWTAPGDDGATGTASSYDVRYSTSTITEGNWASATQATGEPSPSVAGTTENFTVTGLATDTTYYFAVKTSDEIPNESGISNVVSAATLSPDTTAPSAVSDLASGDTTATTIDIGWTAPGDDGGSGTATSYDVRYSTSTINEGNWASATPATGEPTPSVAGTSETMTITGLTEDTLYYIALKTSDEVPNESALSNVISVSTADATAPSAVSDLASGTVGASSIQLTWTAPGDDAGVGTATSYDVRYSTATINEGNWEAATGTIGEPSPSVAGTSESFTVTGLLSNTTYYFAIKTSDEVPNESAISNVISETTLAAGSSPSATAARGGGMIIGIGGLM